MIRDKAEKSRDKAEERRDKAEKSHGTSTTKRGSGGFLMEKGCKDFSESPPRSPKLYIYTEKYGTISQKSVLFAQYYARISRQEHTFSQKRPKYGEKDRLSARV